MDNPFDDMMNEENEEEIEEKPHPKVKKKKDHVQFSLSVNKTLIERGAFIAAILLLAILLIWNPFSSSEDVESEGVTSFTGNAIDEAVVPEKNEVIEQPVIEETVEAPKIEENLPYAGNFDFVLDDIDYVKNEDGKPMKMDKLVFSMVNRWKDLKPRVVVYWYDDESSDAIKEKIRAIQTLKEINKGSKQTITIDQFGSTYFDPQMDKEVIKLELYDRDTNKLLDTIKKVIG